MKAIVATASNKEGVFQILEEITNTRIVTWYDIRECQVTVICESQEAVAPTPVIQNTVSFEVGQTYIRYISNSGSTIESKVVKRTTSFVTLDNGSRRKIYTRDGVEFCYPEGQPKNSLWLELNASNVQEQSEPIKQPDSKASATKIELERLEGQECALTLVSWEEAEKTLREWALSAPDLGYDKCNVTIYFDDGESFECRFDLQKRHAYKANLAGYIKKELLFMSGEYTPSHMTKEQHSELLDSCGGVATINLYKALLDSWVIPE